MTDAAAARRLGWLRGVDALRVPYFRAWFLSQILSAAGTMMQIVAVSWLVLRVSHSGVDVGLLSAFALLPVLVIGPWAGWMSDRFDRRHLLIATQSALIATSVAQALATARSHPLLWLIFLIALASGVVGSPDGAARQVYANDLVGPERLTSAVGLTEVVINLSRVLGPAVAGLLLATLGVSACCWANAASFVPSLVVLLTQRGVRTRPTGERRHDHRFATGWRYAWRHPTIRLSLALAAASGLLFNLSVPLPLLAARTFHVGAGGYGLMMAAFGVGGVGGAALAASAHEPPSRRQVLLLGAATGVVVLLSAAAFDRGAFYLGLAAAGCVSIWFVARTNAYVQLATEPELRGRVMAVWTMALPGFMPIASPIVGWIGSTLGPRAAFATAGVLMLGVAALGSLRGRQDARREAA